MLTTAAALAVTAGAGMYLDGQTNLSRDIKLLVPGIRLKLWFAKLLKNNNISLYNRFEEQCQIRPHSVSIVFEDHSYTWRDLEIASNRMAHWYLSQGVQPKSRVAMFMVNSPRFLISWLALLKIKAVAAFINNQIMGPVLIHSLQTASSDLLVFDYELVDALKGSLDQIKNQLGYRLFCVNTIQEIVGLGGNTEEFLEKQEPLFFKLMDYQSQPATGFPTETRSDVEPHDPAALIYTSGTTGFPKAAVMDHARCNLAAAGWAGMCDMTEKDRLYDCLPLYHSAGAVIGVCHSWVAGSTVVLAKKFSVQRFWRDVQVHEVTVFQYIGELCRYLLNAPENKELDKGHKIRLMLGNGLRPDVWPKFQERFGIKSVFEFYTMSESTGALFNKTDSPVGAGAVGFRGPLLSVIQPGLKIIKVDMETEELIRDKDGYCIECDWNETGELISLADNSQPYSRFTGYFNQPKMTNAKLIQNVFKTGDQYMRTGDLLYRSKAGFWYFADRAGDTYRWKGENVSTAEIADTLGRCEGIKSCTVYGVAIHGQDGKAGMAALVVDEAIVTPKTVVVSTSEEKNKEEVEFTVNESALQDLLDRLSLHVSKTLPAYAIPRFVRICEQELEITGTFKNKKVELKKEGFDLEKVSERLYWWTPQGRYVRFGKSENAQILAGKARL